MSLNSKNEISVAGAVAGYNAPLSGAPIKKIMTKPFDKKNNPKRKKMKKKAKKVPYDIVDEQSHEVIRDTIFKIILEGKNEDKINYITSLIDGINKQMGVSMNHVKGFVSEQLRVEDKNNFNHPATELRHVKRLIGDLEVLINKVCEVNDK